MGYGYYKYLPYNILSGIFHIFLREIRYVLTFFKIDIGSWLFSAAQKIKNEIQVITYVELYYIRIKIRNSIFGRKLSSGVCTGLGAVD